MDAYEQLVSCLKTLETVKGARFAPGAALVAKAAVGERFTS